MRESTPQIHIAVFGTANAGKSALVNALVGHELTAVDTAPGTTGKTLFLPADVLPIGHVMLLDTAALRPTETAKRGTAKRHVPATTDGKQAETVLRVVDQADFVILVINATAPALTDIEQQLLTTLAARELPYVIAINKVDLLAPSAVETVAAAVPEPSIMVSAIDGRGIAELRARIAERRLGSRTERLLPDLVGSGDTVLVVTGSEAMTPRNRIAPPISRLTREILDAGAIPVLVTEVDLPRAILTLNRPPALVVADTNNLDRMSRMIPPDIPLTSLAILLANMRGNLGEYVDGMRSIAQLRPGDRVLIAEGCRYRQLGEQAGFASLPAILRTLVGGPLQVDSIAGPEFPDTLRDYRLVVHCNGCSLSRSEVFRRQGIARRAGTPMVNGSILQSFLSHSLPRALAPLRKSGALGAGYDDAIDHPKNP